MSLYVCDECLAVENTALGNYWIADGEHNLCSECWLGVWHGRFEKRKATPEEIRERRDEFEETDGLRAVLGTQGVG